MKNLLVTIAVCAALLLALATFSDAGTSSSIFGGLFDNLSQILKDLLCLIIEYFESSELSILNRIAEAIRAILQVFEFYPCGVPM